METIKIITGTSTKTLEVAAIYSIMAIFKRNRVWLLKGPIMLDGKELPADSDLNFGYATIEMSNQTVSGNVTLFVDQQGGATIRCSVPMAEGNALTLNKAVEAFGASFDLNDVHGDVGPFISYDLEVHLDTDDFKKSYFAATVKVFGVKVIDTRLDSDHPEISFGGDVGIAGVKISVGVDFNGGRVYLDADISYFGSHKKYSATLYSWNNYKSDFLPVNKAAANSFVATNSNSGWIAIDNEGGYVAKFDVSYTLNGQRFTENTGDFTLGVTKVIDIPAGATDIVLHAWDAYWFSSWKEIFSKHFDSPVTKKYKVYGTTLNPKYKEIDI